MSLGLGREAVSSAVVARPMLREGRSAAFMAGAPKLEEPMEGIFFPVYAFAPPHLQMALVRLQPSINEGTNAEQYIDEAKQGHCRLLDDRCRMRELNAARQAEAVDIGGDRAQKA